MNRRHHLETHGELSGMKNGKKTAEYDVWRNMRRRCNDPYNERYKYYGGRGIEICTQWSDFAVFLKDMGRRPNKKYSIDRKNNNGNYEPSNCRWVTMKTQCRNRTSSRLIEYNGERITIAEASEKTGLESAAIRARIDKLGWSDERALTTPHMRVRL